MIFTVPVLCIESDSIDQALPVCLLFFFFCSLSLENANLISHLAFCSQLVDRVISFPKIFAYTTVYSRQLNFTIDFLNMLPEMCKLRNRKHNYGESCTIPFFLKKISITSHQQ